MTESLHYIGIHREEVALCPCPMSDLEAPVQLGDMASLRVRGKGNKERMVWLTSGLYTTIQAAGGSARRGK